MRSDPGDPQTYAIIGAAIQVHNILGPGFLETVYHEAICREFVRNSLPFRSEVPVAITYKGDLLSTTYRADLICFGEVLVELKALPAVGKIEKAQILNYLKVSNMMRGLLLNFGGPSLEYKRFIHSAVQERPARFPG